MADRFHLRGVLLPDGEVPCDLWIADGHVSRESLPDCHDLAPPGGFISPGLVDCHVHISWGEGGHAAAGVAEAVESARDVLARQGTLLVRDMGAADDAMLAMVSTGEPLARVIGCGMMVLPYDEGPFTRTSPGQLVAAFAERLAHGATWIKVFADWTRDYGGSLNTGFSAEDRVSYPLDELREATNLAHDAGARVAAHAFGHAGAQTAIEAGVDSLEHGWGLDAALVDRMVEQQVAWVPLLSISRAMRWGARQAGQMDRVAWIDSRLEAMKTLLPRAVAGGVEVLAGTDWGPGIPVAQEVEALHAAGLSTSRALAAATTAARQFLKAPTLEHGAPADLVVFRHDPRADLSRLFDPELILLGGRSVSPDAPPPPPPPPE